MLAKSDKHFLRSGQMAATLLVFLVMSGSVYAIDVKLGQDTQIIKMNWHDSWAAVPSPTNPGTDPPDWILYQSSANKADAQVHASSLDPECADAQSASAIALVGIEFMVVGEPGQSAQATITINYTPEISSSLSGGGTAHAIMYNPENAEQHSTLCTTFDAPVTCNQRFGPTYEELTMPMLLAVGQTYQIGLTVYAHADICQGISRADSTVTINQIGINFGCDFSNSYPLERCYGGIGSQCDGVLGGWLVKFGFDDKKCYANGPMSAGSILHDKCCHEHDNIGRFCSNSQIITDICSDEWELAREDWLCGRYVRKAQFGPYFSGNIGDDVGEPLWIPAGERIDPSYEWICESHKCEADKDGNPIIKGLESCSYCICSK
jgi:hypothetical protein